ncbi:glycosyltransferase family 39 protein [Nonlabens xiamenensis]|uniref:glycosyltransferase family 39 protein n=1 Tax=Nonlabens xiamenensis TaxID=2341043 RepID=UPI000F60C2BE|nr:glycosyltransferase family 39 protein [Nonlabens xiamenensis]
MIGTILLVVSITLYAVIFNNVLGARYSTALNTILFSILSVVLHGFLFILSTYLGIGWLTVISALLIMAIVFFIINRHTIKDFFRFDYKVSYAQIVFAFMSFCGLHIFETNSIKYGRWDAYAIWNVHAKFLYEPVLWERLLDERMTWGHSDYPLLFPSVSAMFWRIMESTSPVIPLIVSFLIYLSILFVMYSSFSTQKGKILALVGVGCLSVNADFITKTATQYADSAVALFYLITILLLYKVKDGGKKSYVLLGIFASINCWIKNEGFVFFLIVSAVVFLYNLKNIKNLLFYLYGLAILFLTHISYRVFLSPKNDLTSHSYDKILEDILNITRYEMVYDKLISLLYFEFPLILIGFFISILLLGKRFFKELPLVVLLITFVAYCAFFIITPLNLQWHLDTALDRLLLQLYPSIILVTLTVVYHQFQHKLA